VRRVLLLLIIACVHCSIQPVNARQSTSVITVPPPCGLPDRYRLCSPTPTSPKDKEAADRIAAERQEQFTADRELIRSFDRTVVDAYSGTGSPSKEAVKQLRGQGRKVVGTLPRIGKYIGVSKLPKPTEQVAKPVNVKTDLLPLLRRITDCLDQIAQTPNLINTTLSESLVPDLQHLSALLKQF
jgi:hypothetical protein